MCPGQLRPQLGNSHIIIYTFLIVVYYNLIQIAVVGIRTNVESETSHIPLAVSPAVPLLQSSFQVPNTSVPEYDPPSEWLIHATVLKSKPCALT